MAARSLLLACAVLALCAAGLAVSGGGARPFAAAAGGGGYGAWAEVRAEGDYGAWAAALDGDGDGVLRWREMRAALAHGPGARAPRGSRHAAAEMLREALALPCAENASANELEAENASPNELEAGNAGANQRDAPRDAHAGRGCSGWKVADVAAAMARLGGSPNDTEPQQVHVAIFNETAFTIMWVTKEKQSDSAVQWSVSGGATSSVSPDVYTYHAGTLGWRGWIYRAVIAPVPRSASVTYRVGCACGGWSESFSFTSLPSSPNPDPAVYAVFGDMGTIMPLGFAVTRQMVADLPSTPFAAVVHAGDVAYAGTGASREFEGVWDLWGRQVQPLAATRPYMTAVGNHEKYFNFTSYLARLHMPTYHENGELRNFYYSFDHGSVHFTMMSTEEYAVPYDPGSPQYKWLEADLKAANANRDKTPWIVLVGHRPMYSSDASSDSGPLQAEIEPLLRTYGVDVCVWGHMHEYERSYPVYNNTASIPPSDPNQYRDPPATVHLTIGTAGAMILERWVHPQPEWSAFRAERYGYGQLHVANSTHLTFNFMEMHSASVFDSFSIVRSSPPA